MKTRRRLENRIRLAGLRSLLVPILGLFVVLIVCGALIFGFEIGKGRAPNSNESVSAAAQTEIDNLQTQVTSLESQVSTLQGAASSMQAEKQQLDQQAAAQAQQAQALQTQQAAADANSFGDGLYQVGADIKAGQYHTAGGTSCYWAKLHTSDTNDIIDNNISSGPQTVTINSPYFITHGCDTWTKVG